MAKDVDGVLLDRMNTTVDGEYQKLAVESGAYIREHFFGPDPRLRKMVEDLSDDELRLACPAGGHDYRKLYAAYKLATEQRGAPTVILAKTIKGWTLGPEIEARNATHQIKKMTKAQLRALRDRLYLTDDIPDAALEGDPPYIRPAEGSDAMEYLRARGPRPRRAGAHPGGASDTGPAARRQGVRGVRRRVGQAGGLDDHGFRPPAAEPRARPDRGPLVAPIVSDEARTFGLEPLIAEAKIYAPDGQNYIPVDADLPLNYAESSSGQLLQEGITEAGALAAFTALSTAYATWGQPMVPVYLFYSMFGFQRVGDLAWALGDMRGRGILAGCTAGRTTLMGEGSAARRRAVAPAGLDQPRCLGLRRVVRLRGGGDHGSGGGRHARPGTRRPFLVPHPLQRDVPHACAPRRRAGGRGARRGSSTASTASRSGPRRAGELTATLCFSGPMWSVAVEAQRDAGRTLRAWRPTPGP